MQTQNSPVLIRNRFDDCDAFAEAIVGWDLDFIQLEPGPFDAGLAAVMGSELATQRVAFNRKVHQRGIMPEGSVTFGLPDSKRLLSWLARKDIPRCLLGFNGKNGYESVSDCGFRGFTFSMTSEAFCRELKSLDPSGSFSEHPGQCELILISDAESQRLETLAQSLFLSAARNPDGLSCTELESDILHLLARATLRPDATVPKSTLTQRQKSVGRAIEHIRVAKGKVTVGDVYRTAHVSWRTLDRGFQEQFGITPKQYIVASRLHQTRRDLITAGENRTVTEIALQQGFHHLGRFSADYKAMFGELPSETVQQRKSRGM